MQLLQEFAMQSNINSYLLEFTLKPFVSILLLTLKLGDLPPNVKSYITVLLIYSEIHFSFNGNPECLHCIGKTKELTLLYIQREIRECGY